jgi:hypothetical protein
MVALPESQWGSCGRAGNEFSHRGHREVQAGLAQRMQQFLPHQVHTESAKLRVFSPLASAVLGKIRRNSLRLLINVN